MDMPQATRKELLDQKGRRIRVLFFSLAPLIRFVPLILQSGKENCNSTTTIGRPITGRDAIELPPSKYPAPTSFPSFPKSPTMALSGSLSSQPSATCRLAEEGQTMQASANRAPKRYAQVGRLSTWLGESYFTDWRASFSLCSSTLLFHYTSTENAKVQLLPTSSVSQRVRIYSYSRPSRE
jgi:hypothetical protein